MPFSAFERGVLYAALYALVEVSWTAVFKQDEEKGGTVFRPTMQGTSSPLAAPLYGAAGVLVLEGYLCALSLLTLPWITGLIVRALMFPVVMWLIEIAIGAVLWYPPKWLLANKLKGQGLRAWHYYGRWAKFNQFIDLRMYIAWALLWVPIEFFILYLHGQWKPF